MKQKTKGRRELSLGVGSAAANETYGVWKSSLGLQETPDLSLKPMSPHEATIVKETEEEFKRRGHWKRVFPSIEYAYYKQFFLAGERPLNRLLDERIMAKRRIRTVVMLNK